jgi:hypothetical protein
MLVVGRANDVSQPDINPTVEVPWRKGRFDLRA